MREYLIKENDSDQRLDRFISKALPRMPQSLCQKFIRTKRIKVNGKRSEKNYRLRTGDTVTLYVGDEYFVPIAAKYEHLAAVNPELDIIYEDENILVVDKKPGIVCQPDTADDKLSLVSRVQAYLLKTKKWNPKNENAFAPALCNRIDRNTGGIVLAAKNAKALMMMNQKIAKGEVGKYYLCVTCGVPEPERGILKGYILKDGEKNQVSVKGIPSEGAKYAVTKYKVLKTKGDLSLVECEILTGRTHQIRAQMSNIGYPLAGDSKYGGKIAHTRGQSLYAYKVQFNFLGDSGILEYLKGKEFRVSEVDFAKRCFDFNI